MTVVEEEDLSDDRTTGTMAGPMRALLYQAPEDLGTLDRGNASHPRLLGSGVAFWPLTAATTREGEGMVCPPNSFALEAMNDRGWSIETLAERAELPVEMMREFILVDWPMEDRLACGLKRAFGTSASLWRNLDDQYQRGSARE